MRDLSCFGDGAVSLAGAAVSSSAATAGPGPALDRSLQAATDTVYKAALSSRKELLVKVTWTRSLAAAAPGATCLGLAVAVDDGAGLVAAAAPQILQKRRGCRSFVTEAGTVVAIYWDTADAKYHPAGTTSPEPSRDYYLAVVADAELALLLGGGEAARELGRRFAAAPRRAVILSRREQLRAPPPPSPAAAALAHSTRCRFRDEGAEHEVTVACRGAGEERGSRDGEVAVSIDGTKVVEARRVKWNFRGNRTAVLGDGAVVEVMWDVHDWLFGSGGGGGGAQFMVKARGAGEGGRVWMDEEMSSKGQPPGGFFLHMQCYRR